MPKKKPTTSKRSLEEKQREVSPAKTSQQEDEKKEREKGQKRAPKRQRGRKAKEERTLAPPPGKKTPLLVRRSSRRGELTTQKRSPYWTTIVILALFAVAVTGVLFFQIRTGFLSFVSQSDQPVAVSPDETTGETAAEEGDAATEEETPVEEAIVVKGLAQLERRNDDLPFSFNIPERWSVLITPEPVAPGTTGSALGVFLRVDPAAVTLDGPATGSLVTGTSYAAGTILLEVDVRESDLEADEAVTDLAREAVTLGGKGVTRLTYATTVSNAARSVAEYYVEDDAHGVAYVLRVVTAGYGSYAPYADGAAFIVEFEKSFRIDA